jgi:hypothetical protein
MGRRSRQPDLQLVCASHGPRALFSRFPSRQTSIGERERRLPWISAAGFDAFGCDVTELLVTFGMPEISRFLGIVIAIYWKEHGVPHFHAKYGSHRASFGIADLRLLEGGLPPRVTGLVLEWAALHRDELMQDWELAMAKRSLKPIAPLE